MRTRTQQIVPFSLMALLLASAPVSAQYFDYQPHKPAVEIDLGVLDEMGGGQAHPSAPYNPSYRQQPPATPRAVESIPLPPVTAIPRTPRQPRPLPAPSAYERERVVPRVDLNDSRPSSPSPYAPDAFIVRSAPIAPPPAKEPQRTAPAIVKPALPKSPLDGGPPVMVEGKDLAPLEMPAQNVSSAVRGTPAQKAHLVKPPAPAAAAKNDEPPAKPVRKPEHISIAAIEEPAPHAPAITEVDEPAPDLPLEIAHTDREVIDDLYTLPPQHAAAELSPVMEPEQMPALIDDAPRAEMASAATPAAIGIDDAARHTLVFSGAAHAFDTAMNNTIDSAAAELKKDPARRLMIESYATGEDGSRAAARKLSLSRALSVRAQLMDRGIEPGRVDVRARGNESTGGNADRIDLILSK